MTARFVDTTVLKTDRLTLRMPVLADWPAHRAFSMSDAAAPLGGPFDERSAWRMFAGLAGHWALHGYGWFAMQADEGVVGVCGLHFPPTHSDLEIGWVTYAPAQRKGYATEAARAALDWAWGWTDADRIVSFIDRDNTASQSVARRLGATCDGETARHDPLCEVWVHERVAA
jgi:RimJ/RimL family protein N-acetyltransferase